MTPEARATELLRRHKIKEPPVDVAVIAQKEGAKVIFQDLEAHISGLLVQKDKTATIAVNALHHPNRQRFTVAHELGHYLMHADKPTVFVDETLVHFRADATSEPADRRETEANKFAAALLMPSDWLKNDLGEQNIDAFFGELSLERLARRYLVSQLALSVRLVNLGLLAGIDGRQ
jgi:Zn-dependent peptidase ImmA (M78 family)